MGKFAGEAERTLRLLFDEVRKGKNVLHHQAVCTGKLEVYLGLSRAMVSLALSFDEVTVSACVHDAMAIGS